TEERIVLALVPVFDKEMRRWGTLSGAIIVDKIYSKMKNMKVGKSGFAVLFNHDGQLIHEGVDQKLDHLWRDVISQNDTPFFGGPPVAASPKALNFTSDGLKYHLFYQQLKIANCSFGYIRCN